MTKHNKNQNPNKRIKYDDIEGVYRYKSSSDPSLIYEVMPPTSAEMDWFCSCTGFHYRKQCRHVDQVKRLEELRLTVPGIHERLI